MTSKKKPRNCSPITKEEVRIVIGLLSERKTYMEVGEIVKRGRSTINHIVSAVNAGFETPRAYDEDLARNRGYSSARDYTQIKFLLRNPTFCIISSNGLPSKQEKFERKIKPVGKLEDVADTDYEIPGWKEHSDRGALEYALERLKEARPKMYKAIIDRYYSGLQYNKIAEDDGVGKAAINLRIHRGLKYLKEMLEKRRVGG